jgi:hypothetical protein
VSARGESGGVEWEEPSALRDMLKDVIADILIEEGDPILGREYHLADRIVTTMFLEYPLHLIRR